MTLATVKQLFIHPIKGLTPQECDRVSLKAEHGIPGDRAFALMYEDGTQLEDHLPAEVPWMSKGNFAMQNDWPGLAALHCNYDVQSDRLIIKRQDTELLVAATNTQTDRDRINAFFTEYLQTLESTPTARHPHPAPVKIVGSGTGITRYPDRQPVHISIIGQGTLDHIAEVAGQSIDPRRFRPNILLEGIPAWEEFNWIGQEFQLGSAKIAIAARIGRCVNIEVNPDTGDRDLSLFSLLPEHFGHAQTGVLATVLMDGVVAQGDPLTRLNF